MRYIVAFLLVIVALGFVQFLFYNPIKQPISSDYTELSFGRLAYDEFGSGNETIIMVHGSPGGKYDFKTLGPELSNYHVYAIDSPCFGESDFAKDCGIDFSSEVVREFMDEKQISKTVILGYSWGGGAAIEFAHSYPERTSALILLSGMGIQEGEPTGSFYLEKARSYLSYPFVVYYPGALGGDIKWRKAFMMSYIDTDQRPLKEHLSEIYSPALVLHGENDTVIPRWVAETHASLLKNSNLEFYNGGHGKIFSDTSEMSEKINSFLIKNG